VAIADEGQLNGLSPSCAYSDLAHQPSTDLPWQPSRQEPSRFKACESVELVNEFHTIYSRRMPDDQLATGSESTA
jgi:hypothetical protein